MYRSTSLMHSIRRGRREKDVYKDYFTERNCAPPFFFPNFPTLGEPDVVYGRFVVCLVAIYGASIKGLVHMIEIVKDARFGVSFHQDDTFYGNNPPMGLLT